MESVSNFLKRKAQGETQREDPVLDFLRKKAGTDDTSGAYTPGIGKSGRPGVVLTPQPSEEPGRHRPNANQWTRDEAAAAAAEVQANDEAAAEERFGGMTTDELLSYVPTDGRDRNLYNTFMRGRLSAAESLNRQSKQAKSAAASAGNDAEAYREFLGMPGASDEEIFGLAQAIRENNAQARSLEPQRWLEYAEGLQQSQQQKQALAAQGVALENRAAAANEQGQVWEYSNLIGGYGELINSADFAKKSQYTPTDQSLSDITKRNVYDSQLTYRAINGDREAQDYILRRDSTTSGFSPIPGDSQLGYRGGKNDYLFKLTDPEKSVYNALYASSPKAASDFVEKLKPYLEARARDSAQTWASFMAQRFPALTSIATIPAGVEQSREYLTQIGDLISNGKINQNSADYRASQMSNAVRGEVSKMAEEKWGKVGSAAYNLGMSMADFLTTTAVGGGTKALSLGLMGTRAAASTVLNLKDRGLDDTAAFTLGSIAGAAEIITESFSLEKLLNPNLVADGIAKNILKNFLAEASEEGASDLINWAAEYIYDAITGNNEAEWKQKVYDAIQNGADPNDAVLAAIQDNLVQLGTDMLSGGISGGIMSAAGTPFYLNNFNASEQGQYANAIRGNEADLQALIQRGLESPQNTESYQLAQAVLKQFADGKAPSALTIARLAEANQQQAENEAAEQSGQGRFRLTLPRTVETQNAPQATPADQSDAVPANTTPDTNGAETNTAQEPPPVPQETSSTPGLTLPARTAETAEGAAETPRLTLPARTTEDGPAETPRLTLPTSGGAEQIAAFEDEQDTAERAAQAESKLVTRLRASNPGLLMDEYASGIDENERRAIDETAKRLGLRVGFSDTVSVGQDNAKIYDDGVVLIEKNNPNPIGFLYGHEMGHWLQQNSPEAYNEFAEAARTTDPEWFKAREEATASTYRNAGIEISPERLQEEVLSDYAGWLVQDADVLNRFINQNKDKPNVLRRLYEAIKALAAKLTGRERQQANTAADLLLRAMNATEAAVQNGIMSTGDTRSSFGGILARYADMEAQERAEDLHTRGNRSKERGPVFNNYVRRKTGWFKGGDGLWRFEIDDHGSSVSVDESMRQLRDNQYSETANLLYRWNHNLSLTSDEWDYVEDYLATSDENEGVLRPSDKAQKFASGHGTIGDVLEHKELYRQYPFIATVPLKFENLGLTTLGSTSDSGITLNTNLLKNESELRSTLLHEIQHLIQREEGFARGSNTRYWQMRIDSGMDTTRPSEVNALKEYNRIKSENPDLVRDAIKLDQMFNKNDDDYDILVDRDGVAHSDEWVSKETGEIVPRDEVWGEYEKFRSEMDDKYGKVLDEYYDVLAALASSPEDAELLAITGPAQRSADEMYLDTYGEQEARNVEFRARLNPEVARDMPPFTGDEDSVFLEPRFRNRSKSSTKGLDADTAPESMRKTDEDYMAAVNSGDMETVQRMVDEAAKTAGYTIKAYHGTTDDFTKFSRGEQGRNHDGYLEFGGGFYFTPSENEAREWVRRGRSGLSGKAEPKVMSVYLSPRNIINADEPIPRGAEALQSMGMSKAEANFVAGRTYRFINYLAEDKGFNNTEIQDELKSLGYDAIDATYRNGTSGQYVVFDPEQIKSADPVTYDDAGNPIPLSERFNPDNPDIRHSLKGIDADIAPESIQRNDENYTAALDDGDIAKAAQLVHEAADAAMPDSKVRNASTGELRYVYHYTNKNFYEFRPMGQSAGSNRTLGDGYYVSTSETEFKSFGKNKMTLFANITNPFEMELTEEQAQAVYDKYFRPHHEDRFHTYEPHVVGKLQSYSQVFDYLKEAAEKNGTTTSAILSELGFDGVHSGPEWVAFYPEQLKSADVATYNDDGQLISLSERFNPEKKDTRYSLKGLNADIAPASVQKNGQMPASKNDRVERMKFKYEQAIEEQKGKTFQANAQRNSDLARQKREFQEKTEAQRKREAERRERTTFKHEQEVEEAKGKLFQERARRYSELAKQKREFQEKEAKGKEERKARELREKIATHTKKLLSDYERNTDKHHVPDGLRGAVNAVLSSINMSSGYSLVEDGDGRQLRVPVGEGVAETKRTQAFAQLRSELEQERERLVLDWSMVDDPDGALNRLVGEWADTPIANMDSEQLRSVYDVLRNVEHAIKTADKMLSQARWGNVSNFADALREENVGKNQPLQLNGKLGNALKHVRLDILTPEAYFHRLGDSGEAVFKMLRGGQDSYIRNITNAVNATKDILKDADVRKLETDKHTVTLGGTEVTMSTAQLMELYCLMQRDQGMQHISTGGVVVEPGRGVKKNTQLDPIHPTEQELNDAIDQLTPEQIRMAEAMQEYLTKDMSDLGNEATMQVYGYKKFGNEDNYWKIRSNKNELQSTVEKDTQTTSVANKGFTKATKPNANTSVLIGSAFDTFSQSVSDMATYSAWLAISEDLNRIRNYTFRDENGNRITTIQTILDRVHGESGANYFKQLMADIANGTQNDAGLTEGFVGAYKAAAIGANIRVIVQQPTAVLRALEMIDPKYFANAKDPFKAFERAKKYAPIAQWKDWGYFDINTGRKMKDVLMESAETPLEKARQALMSPAGKADSWAWGILWNAVEKETAKTTDLTPGSDEFYQHCAERFGDIIDHTQVVDGIIQRSPIQRSKNSINKMASSFMSEPLKQYAQFMSAVYDVKNGKNGAGKHLVRTTVAMAAAGLLNNAVQSLVDALRDDDKEKKYWEKFLEKFLGYNSDDDTIRKKLKTFLGSNMGELVNPAEYIPYAKDIMSIYKGYDVERMDMSLVADLVTAVNRLQNTLAGDTKYTVANAVASVTEQLAKLTGIPAANIDRDIKSILNTVANEADIPLLQYYMNRYQFKPAKSGNLSKDLVNILWSAKQKGDDDYQAVYDRLIADGYSEDVIETEMLSKLSETTGLTQAIKDADAAGNANKSYDTMEILSAFRSLNLPQDEEETLLKWKLTDGQWEKYATLKDAGIGRDIRFDIMQKYSELNPNKEIDRALEFEYYVDGLGLTSEQAQLVKDTYKFWTQVPAEAKRYETVKLAGLSDDKAKHITEVLGALEPLPGKEYVTDMQSYRAIESDKILTNAEKINAIGSIMGPELKTEQGNPTQWAKFQRAVNDGVGIGKALDMVEHDSLDIYVKMKSTGMSSNSAVTVAEGLKVLKPLPGKESVTDVQRYRKIASMSSVSTGDKLKAIGAYMGTEMKTKTGNPSQWATFNTALNNGQTLSQAIDLCENGRLDEFTKWTESAAKAQKVTWDVFDTFLKETAKFDGKDDNGKSVNGLLKERVVTYIDSLNLTPDQKDALLTDYNPKYKHDVTWHNGSYGSSGTGKTYAPADTGKLRLPPSARMDEQDRELWDMESHGGNVNLRTRKTIPVTNDNIGTVKDWGMDSRVGDYMTVASQTYRDGDRAVVVTPILPDGSLMTQAELDTYMDSLRGSDNYADADERGIILGVFDSGTWQQNLKDSDAFAERIHELHEEREEKRKTSGLKLPSTPERREPISSGLKLQSTPAAKPSSGGLKLR